MVELLNWLFGQYADYPTLFIVLELMAVVFGVTSVMLASRTNILVFPVGLVSTAIFVYLLWKWQLFGDMFINAYYTVMSIYGWINWTQNKERTQYQDHINPTSQQHDSGSENNNTQNTIEVEHLSKKDLPILALLATTTAAFVALIYYFRPVINNNFSFDGAVLGLHLFTWVDYTDMLTTALFLMAMWLMARRKIEHWLLWIIADAISVPLYFYKGLTFTALQYVVFTLIAIWAYYEWQRRYRMQPKAAYA
ncbi:nicotinamide riboside transporter PnuC [Psychrobacter sp. AOP22-C1-22]|uniref:nicotinamide riboside transporter PnuC n=1 Tax=unclassified Psychrobacter TaxID=196806 RepID=UPI0017884F01|nr:MULTISPECIES: nicotinamide riboside transporter PnuC [unclassified Psychrobacter]MBE0405366.1 nicotinamide mononucleotide transporter [Psychrobacter sp. FME6]MBE0443680.1 nicotinamide mononucleotide transporter [Psychrobacter sp. FME5]MDN5801745.1 nicotinamide riboside transporter PnuC [Psychrobacter sp.]MDN5898289.1 nicotinamide riboside transporter PnuC [Psychrobacter sp.]